MRDLIHSGVLWPALAVLFASSVIQGIAGLGLALIGVPFLCMWFPMDAAVALVTITTVTVSGLIVFRLWSHCNWPRALWLGVPTVLLAPAGVYLLLILTKKQLYFVIGVVLIVSAIYGWWKLARQKRTAARLGTTDADGAVAAPPGGVAMDEAVELEGAGLSTTAAAARFSPTKLAAIGSVSGVMGGAVAMNGPLIADYLNKSGIRPEEYLVTLNVIFLASAVTRVGLYCAGGLVSAQTMWLALATWPAVVIGVVLGGKLSRLIPRAAFVRVIDGFLVLIGVYMLIQACR
ncbi:MAG: sulfite exporter TauE/SafE family protein [Planctomycetota bacterium]